MKKMGVYLSGLYLLIGVVTIAAYILWSADSMKSRELSLTLFTVWFTCGTLAVGAGMAFSAGSLIRHFTDKRRTKKMMRESAECDAGRPITTELQAAQTIAEALGQEANHPGTAKLADALSKPHVCRRVDTAPRYERPKHPAD